MFVVVALTIWAPSRVRTTCTDVPVRLAPAGGWTIPIFAGEEGRFPLAEGDGVAAPGVQAPASSPAKRHAARAMPVAAGRVATARLMAGPRPPRARAGAPHPG